MKIILLLFFLASLSCGKDNDNNSSIKKVDILGDWVNLIDIRDTLFIQDTIIKRIDTLTLKPKHAYTYSLYKDSIKIKYVGEYYIYIPESSFKIMLDDENKTLTIENFSNYYPRYAGDIFKKLTIKN